MVKVVDERGNEIVRPDVIEAVTQLAVLGKMTKIERKLDALGEKIGEGKTFRQGIVKTTKVTETETRIVLGDYGEAVEEIPIFERPVGPLLGIAARLDYVGPKVEELIPKVEELIPKVAGIEDTVKEIESAVSNLGVAMKIEQIPFAYTLTALKGVMLSEYAPFPGYIRQVSIHWPNGCNSLVDVKIGHGTKQFCPDDGYLALNDVTPSYPFNERVRDHEEIWVEMANHDGVNSHAIKVTITLEASA